ncbi:hypothetical protein [Caproicibacterium argilliputei]|uniref:Myb-like domain-containing protein n=1 Tax=Caproicibacterium argilliputei TaxID=3030016 RepID=A0AA97H2S8_9FIRM|nr:hypothetical protein [Caproicibacterium argilliputei]WOC33030.1 hypothetical protein PXC00_03895 [Caproicibacterium argilliputei]
MMEDIKKAASGAGNTTDSKANQTTKSVAQQSSEVKPYAEGQRTAIRMAYHAAEKKARELNDPKILADRVEVLTKQFRPYGFSREQVVAIGSGVLGSSRDRDYAKPIIEHKHPTVWTPEEEEQLRIMKEKGVANSEICEQLHKTAQQVSSKWCFMRKATGKIKEPEPKSAPAPAEPEKPILTFDLTAVKQPISGHFDIFSTLQDIMRQVGAGYASVSITQQDGTKLKAEVRKDANSKNQVEHR